MMIKKNPGNRRGEASMSWSYIVTWMIIIFVGVLIIFFMTKSKSVGWTVWAKIKEILPFV